MRPAPSPQASPAPPSDRRERRLILAFFLALLAFHVWAVSVGWTHASLYGNEFRETQTAISVLFIQRDGDYSLAYPTPVLGRPWSIPMEFPLYQWAVAGTSNLTGWSLAATGRFVSAACFYLGLPALALLLRRIGLRKPHVLIVLSLVLTSPLYIFYTRAFLIETMALMFGLWYLLALIRALERRHLGWLLLANIAGTAAGLVKVTTFFAFLLPAFACSLWWLWQSRPVSWPDGWRATLRTTGWLVAAHALPFLATSWWVRFADRVKARNPNGAMLESSNLAGFNFGAGRRFDPEVWASHWSIISREIIPPLTLVAGLVLALLFARRWWWQIAAGAGLYLLIQAIFPLLYAWHGYYHVASAFLLLGAVGLALVGAFESLRLRRVVPFALWAAIAAGNVWAYWSAFYETQRAPGHPSGLATAIKHMTEPEETIIVAGDDWASITPYYAERRALMLPGVAIGNEDLLRKAFTLMQDEVVAALVLMDAQRENRFLLRLAREYFDLEAEPSFRWRDWGRDGEMYLHRQVRAEALEVYESGYFHRVERVERAEAPENPLAGNVIEMETVLPRHQHVFRIMQPQPARFFSSFGPELWHERDAGMERYSAHPDTMLWFRLPPGRHRLRTAIELVPGAYEDVPRHESSDGVELVAAAVHPEGTRQVLHRRTINPRDQPAERGPQPIDWNFELPVDAELELSVNAGPHGNGARDWAALSPITIE